MSILRKFFAPSAEVKKAEQEYQATLSKTKELINDLNKLIDDRKKINQ